jgi:hypothetical protein
MTGIRQPHALYRFFAEDGALLYVGITNNPARRFAQHGAARDWWLEVATIRLEMYPSREAVLAAERAAIVAERPRYNVVHANGALVPSTSDEAQRVPTGYPVAAGEVVALALAPNHLGEVDCPVGIVEEVSPFGARLALMSWLHGFFDQGSVMVPWHRIMEIRWAEKMHPAQAEKEGYGRREDIWDCDRLGNFQVEWTKGREAMLAHRREMRELARP